VRSTDAGGLYVEKVFTVTVTDVNEAPNAVDHEYSCAANATLTVTPPGLLLGASDPDSDTLTTTIGLPPRKGRTVTANDPVHRFHNWQAGAHFYTASAAEYPWVLSTLGRL
jgi:hypothetical protein